MGLGVLGSHTEEVAVKENTMNGLDAAFFAYYLHQHQTYQLFDLECSRYTDNNVQVITGILAQEYFCCSVEEGSKKTLIRRLLFDCEVLLACSSVFRSLFLLSNIS